jgi:hypothetical protein
MAHAVPNPAGDDVVEVNDMLKRHQLLVVWVIGAALVLLAVAIAMEPGIAQGLV